MKLFVAALVLSSASFASARNKNKKGGNEWNWDHEKDWENHTGPLPCDMKFQMLSICAQSQPQMTEESLVKCFGDGTGEVTGCWDDAISTTFCEDACETMKRCEKTDCNFEGCHKEVKAYFQCFYKGDGYKCPNGCPKNEVLAPHLRYRT